MPKSVLLDTNLLVLLVVGLTEVRWIERHKRTRAYQRSDYDLLRGVLSRYRQIVVTPNILSEASNLLAHTDDRSSKALLLRLSVVIGECQEDYVKSCTVAQREEFPRLGLADSATLDRAGSVSCVLTDDLALYLAAQREGHAAINFNHLRQRQWWTR